MALLHLKAYEFSLVEQLEKAAQTKCPDKLIKGERGEKGEQGLQGLPGKRGEKGIQGPQGLPGVDGNSAVIMEIVHSKRKVSTSVLTKDQQTKVNHLAQKACKEVYR